MISTRADVAVTYAAVDAGGTAVVGVLGDGEPDVGVVRVLAAVAHCDAHAQLVDLTDLQQRIAGLRVAAVKKQQEHRPETTLQELH